MGFKSKIALLFLFTFLLNSEVGLLAGTIHESFQESNDERNEVRKECGIKVIQKKKTTDTFAPRFSQIGYFIPVEELFNLILSKLPTISRVILYCTFLI